MTAQDEDTLIDAMSVHYLRAKQDIRTMRNNGDHYGPWKAIVAEFYRANPTWTPDAWRNRPRKPMTPGVQIQPLTEGQRYALGCTGFLFVVGLVLWAWLNFLQHL